MTDKRNSVWNGFSILFLAMAVGAVVLGPVGRASAADANADVKKISVLVITGGHGYDKKTFPKTFEGQADIEFKIQEGGEPFEDISKWDYDVMVLYNFNRKISETSRANFLKLLDRGVGLVCMHHALAAYPDWLEYEKIIGATYSLKGVVRNGMKYARPVWKHDVDFNVRIEDTSHPITKGMADFKLNDESYKKWVYHPGSHLLLSTDQKLNNHRLAWARFYGKARVFSIQLGHGKHAFESKDFQTLTARGIRWTAGRLPAGPGADSRKVVFLWSEGHHPNAESSKLFARCLAGAVNAPEVKTEVHENWPADPSTLNDAAAVVLYCEGTNTKGKPHPVLTPERMKILADLKAKGLGVVLVHYSLYGTRDVEAPKMLDWVGAYYDFEGYGSKHGVSRKPLDCSPTAPDHPISRGWKKFTLKENEMYHNLKFAEGASVVPVLSAPLMAEGKGNANVIAWALEPKSGGRGFGFGGGHFVGMWKNEDCRRMMLNGILWAAKIQVPFDGVQTTLSDGFTPLFDGKTLDGWKGRESLWKVEDGAICGQSSKDAKLKHNDFLYTVKEYGDFELTLKYKLVNHNSGVQVRSQVRDDFRVTGYQADIAENRFTGILYEEGGRGIIADVKPAEVSKFIKKGEWNDYRIVCQGKELKFWINGQPTISYTEKKASAPTKGVIAFQLHAGPPMKVYFKDIQIKELPAGGRK